MINEVVKRALSLPPGSTFLILGGGFSGQHIGSVARKLGANVFCSRRNIDSKGADCCFDSNQSFFEPKEILKEVTHLLSCIPPLASGGDPVLKILSKEIKEMPLKWAGYLSTTGVYGDSKGDWVTEKDNPQPKQSRSIRRLACEQEWLASGIPIQILRLPGIYGPGRSSIETIKNKSPKLINKPGHVFSRIHIDDIAGSIMHLIYLKSQGINPEIINITDNSPASNIEVMKFAYELLKNPAPEFESFEDASKKMTPMALSFWQENRRVSNEMLCQKLGYSLIHPDYKSGLIDCLASLRFKGDLNY